MYARQDTHIRLIDKDGKKLIRENRNKSEFIITGNEKFSEINWICSNEGTYYISVEYYRRFAKEYKYSYSHLNAKPLDVNKEIDTEDYKLIIEEHDACGLCLNVIGYKHCILLKPKMRKCCIYLEVLEEEN